MCYTKNNAEPKYFQSCAAWLYKFKCDMEVSQSMIIPQLLLELFPHIDKSFN